MPQLSVLPAVYQFYSTDVCALPKKDYFDESQISGYLVKRKGEKNKKKTNRYCVIKDRILYYFKKHGDSNPQGLIALDGSICALVEVRKTKM